MLFVYFTTALQAAAAQWEGVFEGTIGKAKIIVELNAGSEKSDYKGGYSDGSRYSYLPKAFDLKLLLTNEGRTLTFTEAKVPHYAIADLTKGDANITGFWSVAVMGNRAQGTWTAADGTRSLPIALTRLAHVDEKRVPKDMNILSQTYLERWFKEISLNPTNSTKLYDNVAINDVRDSAFNLELPMFKSHPDAATMTKANAVLHDIYKAKIISTRECINGLNSEPDQPFQPEFSFTTIFASPRSLSIHETGSVFCGGAHPSNYVNTMTLDVINARVIGGEYDLDLQPHGFGTLLKLANKQERIKFENFALARWSEAAKAAGEDNDDGCGGMGFMAEKAPGEKTFSLHLVKTGLAIQRTDYPHAASDCLFRDFNPTIIPWADLKPWLRPDQVLLTTEIQ